MASSTSGMEARPRAGPLIPMKTWLIVSALMLAAAALPGEAAAHECPSDTTADIYLEIGESSGTTALGAVGDDDERGWVHLCI